MLLYVERSKSGSALIKRSLRMTFKKFLMLKKNVKNEIVEDLMQFDIMERSNINMYNIKKKWEQRVGKQLYIPEDAPPKPPQKKQRILPKELQEILNLMTAKCPGCKEEVCKPYHLEDAHKIIVPDYPQIIEEIERRTKEAKDYHLSRAEAVEHTGSFLSVYIESIKKHLDSTYA